MRPVEMISSYQCQGNFSTAKKKVAAAQRRRTCAIALNQWQSLKETSWKKISNIKKRLDGLDKVVGFFFLYRSISYPLTVSQQENIHYLQFFLPPPS